MNRAKKSNILSVILLLAVCFGLIGFFVKIFSPHTKSYFITYKVAGSDENLFPKYDWLKIDGGSYPTEYSTKAGARVSALAGSVSYFDWEGWEDAYTVSYVYNPDNPNEMAAFWAWYLDSDCTEKFNGKIEVGQKGPITLYAKLEIDSESNWTKFY